MARQSRGPVPLSDHRGAIGGPVCSGHLSPLAFSHVSRVDDELFGRPAPFLGRQHSAGEGRKLRAVVTAVNDAPSAVNVSSGRVSATVVLVGLGLTAGLVLRLALWRSILGDLDGDE